MDECCLHNSIVASLHVAISLFKFRNLFVLKKYPKLNHEWLYFKARSKKTLLGGYPSNVKGWKRKFFFVSGKTGSFPKGCLGRLGFHGSKDTLDMEGLYSVPALLESKSFHKSFGPPKFMVSDDGGNGEDRLAGFAFASSGDVGESFHSREESLEYLGTIRREIRRILPHTPDLTLLSDMVLNGTNWVSLQITLTPGIATKARDEASLISLEDANSKGKEALPIPEPKKAKSKPNEAMIVVAPREGTSANPVAALGPQVTMQRSASTAKKILKACIPPIDKEEVDKLELDLMVFKLFHTLVQAVVVMSSLACQGQEIELEGWMVELKVQNQLYAEELAKVNEERDATSDRLAKLKLLVSELREKEARTKRLALAHHHPVLGIDLDAMDMDRDLIAKEKADAEEKEEEESQGKNKKGATRMATPSLLRFVKFCKDFEGVDTSVSGVDISGQNVFP
ncbi:hypothetical protein Acr_12g0000580 [Actinidia rufa]|uniref:Uncharacterized protein n=1 Tax=Actinidia rufa TaxID=165716 RepID=A0A7J0FHZ4_9ERIC|nr:hypothetical protein Acr_12g0000580 [Actinidia rufa]